MTKEQKAAIYRAIDCKISYIEASGGAPKVKTVRTKPVRKGSSPDRKCTLCEKQLSYVNFYVRSHKNKKKYHDSRCDDCRKLSMVCRNHVITPDQYRQIIEKSGGSCEICNEPWSADARPCIDHCHYSGKLRSVLCQRCNTAIGLLRDRVDVITRAAKYITAWESAHTAIPQTMDDVKRELNMHKIRTRAAVARRAAREA